MPTIKSNGALGASLVLAIFLWGANNVGTKFMVATWPPIAVGCFRCLAAGFLILASLRWTRFLGAAPSSSAPTPTRPCWRAGLVLAVYIVAFNWALRYTSASHVALYLGASPVWALLGEGRPKSDGPPALRYIPAALALAGVAVLFWPTLSLGLNNWIGDALALLASLLWTWYGRQCRALSQSLSGLAITGQTFWRAALCLLPLAALEIIVQGWRWRTDLAAIMVYSVVFSGVVAFALWNNALRYWPTSKVFLFNNLIPLSTMAWANVCLGEPVTQTFGLAMALVATGVVLGQMKWQKILGGRWMPAD